MSSSSRLCRPVTLPLLLLLLLLFLTSSSLALADASGQYQQARRLLVSPPSTHKSEQRMRVDGAKKPFRNAGAILGRRKIPSSRWNPIHNR
uniref:Uncharacterized protein n=1 Tax=Aegilops tauschii TaxID=37682 RepID=M8BUE7_AEGTA